MLAIEPARHCKIHLPIEMASTKHIVKTHSGVPGILVKTTRTIYRCTIAGCPYVECKDEAEKCRGFGLE